MIQDFIWIQSHSKYMLYNDYHLFLQTDICSTNNSTFFTKQYVTLFNVNFIHFISKTLNWRSRTMSSCHIWSAWQGNTGIHVLLVTHLKATCTHFGCFMMWYTHWLDRCYSGYCLVPFSKDLDTSNTWQCHHMWQFWESGSPLILWNQLCTYISF